MSINSSTRLDKIPGIGPATSEKLLAVGLESAHNLLYLLPRAWDDLTRLSQISDLEANGQKFTIRATVDGVKMFRTPGRRMMLTQATAEDTTGKIAITWFNQPYLAKSIQAGSEYYVTGLVVQGKRGLMLSNPSLETADHTPLHSGRIIPIYSSVGGLSTKMLRRIFSKLIPALEPIAETLPKSILEEYGLIGLDSALREVHSPTDPELLEKAKQRLAFDELLGVQLQVQAGKNLISQTAAEAIPADVSYIKKILALLPFELTAGQKRALWDILQDLDRKIPTNRLVEGDVGSGKTIVAACAMFSAAHAGFQAALMVPTEVLAQQHFQTLEPLASSLGISIALLTQTKTIGDETANVLIGTHKLIQKNINFGKLNLVIVDEQHRFGVKQREALKLAGSNTEATFPHFISLTATPIPRSLALTLFGDLDLSIIPNRPTDRLPVTTTVLANSNRQTAYKQIKQELADKHQAFVVTPLIATSPKLTAKSAEEEATNLRKAFPEASVGLLHGKLTAEEKASVMEAFKANKINVLVATTVIEVGIDVPNATVMLIEGAERFGLAQLHQLRGRVGRSHLQSHCFLIPTEDDLDIMDRLDMFAKTTDGFKLAELDLELRGPGSLLGTAQAGFVKFRLADWTDPAKIEAAQNAAKSLLAESSDLSLYPELTKSLKMADINFHAE